MKKTKSFADCKKILLCNGEVHGVFLDNVLMFDKEKYTSINYEVKSAKSFHNILLLSDNKKVLYIKNKQVKELKGGGTLRTSLLLSDYVFIPQKVNGIYSFFLYNKDMEIHMEIPYMLNFAYINKLFYYDDKHLKKYNLRTNRLAWEIDISGYGSRKGYNGNKEPNMTDGVPFGYENILYMPLLGGQLVAINLERGDKEWFLDHNVRGKYAIIGDRIYKRNKILYEIDATSGEILRQLNIEVHVKNSSFSTGHMLVYDDVILFTDILRGELMFLCRHEFKILKLASINTSIASRESAVIWNKNKLYVLDADNNVHILEDKDMELNS